MIRSFKTSLVLLAALLCTFGAGTTQPVHAQSNAPGTPSSVTVTRSDGTLTATWPAVAGATSYHVTYSADGGHSWSLAALNHPDASITISSVTNSATYIVGVRARNAHGDSGWRNSPVADPLPAVLTATTDLTDYSVDLGLANGPGNWWFHINSGTCTAASGTEVTGIRGYAVDTQHEVGAYADASCSQALAQASFELPEPYLYGDWDYDSDTVSLKIEYLTTWWFRINDGTCTQVTGRTVTGIAGYQKGEYTVRAYSMPNCTTEVASAQLIVGLWAKYGFTSNDYSLAVGIGPYRSWRDENDEYRPWWFRIDNGTCTQGEWEWIPYVFGIRGYSAGVPLSLHIYADGACSQLLADTTFTVPEPEFIATVQADNTVDLDVYVVFWDGTVDWEDRWGPQEWWFRIGHHACTPVTGPFVRGIAGYPSGTYDVEAFATSNCSAHLASTQFTIP